MQPEDIPMPDTVRPEVMLFARYIERQLKYNEARGKGEEWRFWDLKSLLIKLKSEFKELTEEINLTPTPIYMAVCHEALDVACVCLFIFMNAMGKLLNGRK
jgi:hypothetical protein